MDGIKRAFTRTEKIRKASISNKSAINYRTDHVFSENHLIDWDNVKVMDHESDWTGRVIKETMWIRKTNNINRDDGSD